MALLLGRREGRDVIAAHTVLAHLGGDGKLEFFFTRPLKKPRTECGCQPVLAMMSSIVTPDCRRSISTTRSCLLCEGTIRPLALAVEVFRALPRDFATAVLRRRGMLAAAWEGLVSCVSLMPRARSPLLVMNRPRGRRSSSRRHSGAPGTVRRSSTSLRLHKVSTTLPSAAPLAQALRKGKKRSVGALRRRTQDHVLSIAELGCCGLGL
jgi:hypothetical protein